MKTQSLLVAAALALLAPLAGCAATTAGPSANLAVQDAEARFAVEGEGAVRGGDIACSGDDADRCAGRFDEVWATRVQAQPKPGWRFKGWRRDAAPEIGSQPASQPVVYTAVFEREAESVASR